MIRVLQPHFSVHCVPVLCPLVIRLRVFYDSEMFYDGATTLRGALTKPLANKWWVKSRRALDSVMHAFAARYKDASPRLRAAVSWLLTIVILWERYKQHDTCIAPVFGYLMAIFFTLPATLFILAGPSHRVKCVTAQTIAFDALNISLWPVASLSLPVPSRPTSFEQSSCSVLKLPCRWNGESCKKLEF